jgi:hypothetical protein
MIEDLERRLCLKMGDLRKMLRVTPAFFIESSQAVRPTPLVRLTHAAYNDDEAS